jgi:ParB/RepB/Spo0J family partition protein
MPTLKRLKLSDIDEPQIKARVAMDETKMNELMSSMASNGLLQPGGVKPLPPTCLQCNGPEKPSCAKNKHDITQRYEIVFGHRRYIAATRLHWTNCNFLVYTDKEIETGAAMLAENIEREEMTAAEEALLFAEHMEKYNLDEAGLVARFKKSPDYIGDRLRMLRQDEQVFKALLNKEINFSVARELNKCEDESMRRYYLKQAISSETGARVVAQWVKDWRLQNNPTAIVPVADVAAADLPAVQPFMMRCEFCGGDKDPYNLVSIFIHRYELEQIKVMRERAARMPDE